ncbi:effector-associated domain 2-containing protein [Streptomyces mirabilis]|uniref:effector-associated domain 2-containing protein n=1 Tax=Streptomyces mirabilis TaxID=68239 RepID=UPI00365B9378
MTLEHVDQVRDFWRFLRSCGIDADLDLPAAERRQDWALWMLRGIRDSRHVLVVASPEYRRRSEGDAPAGQGLGVQWEARLLRDLVYEAPTASLNRIIPVVLPGGSADHLPAWLGGRAGTHYAVSDFTVPGAEQLLRLLTGQPYVTEAPLRPVPQLPPDARHAPRGPGAGTPPALQKPVVEPRSVPLPAPPPPSFAFPETKALVDVLMTCEVLHRPDMRHELLALMGDLLGLGHPFAVAWDSDARTHLRRLVRRSNQSVAPDATLKALYVALTEIAPDDTGVERLGVLLTASGLALAEP